MRQDAKTTIDTVSAVRRRLEARRRARSLFGSSGWRGSALLFLVVAMLALLIGRGLRHRGEVATRTARRAAHGVRARRRPGAAPGAPGGAVR